MAQGSMVFLVVGEAFTIAAAVLRGLLIQIRGIRVNRIDRGLPGDMGGTVFAVAVGMVPRSVERAHRTLGWGQVRRRRQYA